LNFSLSALRAQNTIITPQSTAAKKRIIYVRIAVGFAGPIGAREVAVSSPDPGADAGMIVSCILATVRTLAFIVAGLMAFRMMRSGGLR
jgi:hypothetical protein